MRFISHAGYRYSGSAAGYCYQSLEDARDRVKRIFLLGPSHHEPFTGCALPSPYLKTYSTPLGDIKLDLETIEKLAKDKKKWIRLEKEVDEAEHSLEMHLPYIVQAMQKTPFTLVPIMVGSLSSNLEDDYGKILAPFADDEENFFIISSDFCHWGKRFGYTPFNSKAHADISEYITELDRSGMDAIEKESVSDFRSYLHTTKNTICGRNPILVLLAIHQHCKSKFQTKFIHYDQSGKCKDFNDSSVSYAAAVVYKK